MANESARRDTILVVDDTPETLGLLTDTLDHAGFTVLIAMDGHSALELLDQVREVMRLKHYSIRTEQCYCNWIRRYIHFHQMKGREELLAEPEAKWSCF